MVVEQLVKQLKRAETHERVEMIIEVLQMLAENGVYADHSHSNVTNSSVLELGACVMSREIQLPELGPVGSHVHQDRTRWDGWMCARLILVKTVRIV